MTIKVEMVGEILRVELDGEPILEVVGDRLKWFRDDIIAEGKLEIVEPTEPGG